MAKVLEPLVKFIDALTTAPHEVVTLGPRATRAARAVAVNSKLRGADALYVWLARRKGVPLSTLDREIISRGAPFCSIATP